MNAYAIHTGSNYSKQQYKLNGCLNDVVDFINLLDAWFKVPKINTKSFIGADFKKSELAAYARKLIAILKPEDTLLYSNSSHGLKIPDLSGDEVDGYDEALLTDDGKTISDDEIFALLTKIVKGCLVLGWFDNCHAGTMDRSIDPRDNYHYINSSVLCSAVLYFGCKEQGTSADAFINNRYNGAFTFCQFEVLQKYKYRLTYLELLVEINKTLKAHKFKQIAQMACSKGMENKLFGSR